ncbi:MFS transporter [Frondihabitans sucicola]|uniref:MFS transporter n=1 Tax=Frondihabitans sucicola TaxID=1268041 RepID=A0ABM8GME6_9MICO|nr:MFS transporter [Frondihabitans sucicola]BDZ49600.1 MFS transporter [Frondihabitans sucicola]
MALHITRPTIASAVGTALEWYDFTLYSTAAALVLPTVFFPTGNAVSATLASFATFAVGFFARPIGGVIIGNLGDRFGRRRMLFLTLILMAISSTLIGCLPGYATIGIAAPVLLIVLRVFQGFGAGGEYAGATLLAAEHARNKARGLNASIPAVGNAAGSLLATIVFAVVTGSTGSQFLVWGWRIPFLISIFVGIAGVVIRLRVTESPEFVRAQKAERIPRVPFTELFRSARSRVPFAMLASIGPNVASYLPSVYALTYLATSVHAPAWIGLTGIIIGNALKFVTIPTAGWLSDRYGRRPVFLAGAIGAVILAYPFFFLLDTGTPILIWVALVMIFTFCNDAMLAAQSGFMSELFDVRLRYTGVTFSREIPGAVVGGTLPLIATALTAAAGGASWLVALYCVVLMLLAAVGMFFLPETRGSATVTEEAPRWQSRGHGSRPGTALGAPGRCRVGCSGLAGPGVARAERRHERPCRARDEEADRRRRRRSRVRRQRRCAPAA